MEFLVRTARIADSDRLPASLVRPTGTTVTDGQSDTADIVRRWTHGDESDRRPGGADTQGAS